MGYVLFSGEKNRLTLHMSKAKDIRCFLINECSTYSQKVWQILGVFYTLFYKEKCPKKQ